MTDSGCLWSMAILSASSTSSVRMCPAIAQPTTRRLQTSSTTARYRNPDHVGTYVRSASQTVSAVFGREVTIDQIRRMASAALPQRRARPLAPANAGQPLRFHESSDTLELMRPGFAQLAVDARCAICAPRELVDRLDLPDEPRVGTRSLRRLAPTPRVVPASGRHPALGTSWQSDTRPGAPSRTRTLRWDRSGLPSEPGRGFCHYLAFNAQLLHLSAQLPDLLSFLRCQAVATYALVEVGLANPVTDGLPRWLKLAGEFVRAAASSHQLDHLTSKLGWVWRSRLRQGELLSLSKGEVSTKPGQLQTATSTPQATTSTPEAASGWRMPYRLEYSVDESYVLAEAVIAELYEERYATESGAMPDTSPPNDDALTHWLDGGGWHKYRAVRLDITRPLYPPDYSGSGFIVTQSLDRYAVPESVAETAGLGFL